jgi:TetR/AcrR family transcriptional regulator
MKSIKIKKRLGRQSNKVSEKTKVRILTSALKIFARKGFYSANLRDIAAYAGTSLNLIRHHFGSKDDLWKAVVDDRVLIHANHLRQILKEANSTDPVALLKLFITAFISFTAKNADLAKISLSNYDKNSPHLKYLHKKQKIFYDITYPIFKEVKAMNFFKDLNHETFIIYMRALVEIPIVTSYFTNKRLKINILSGEGLAFHTKNVLKFLFNDNK